MIGPEAVQYKIVFCDIDGTLIDSKNQISKSTVQKIRELYRMGIPFIMVSARMPSGILPIQDKVGIKAPIVCYSGALILNQYGNCLKTLGIERKKAVLIDTFVKKEWKHICCSAFCHNNWIVDNVDDKWVVQEQQITSSAPVEGRVSDFILPDGHIHKFLCMGEAEQITALNVAMKEKFPELSIYRSKETYLEIMDGTVSKSGAVRYLCMDYNISLQAAVSFGDNFNDIDMLLATGTSFAMGNAPEEVKRHARRITLDNDHEGVLAGLRQLDFAGKQI
ncbi:Cof-type HAD-IIB family hydrolase [Konateibacter massiliensis]|uniref:Cof-type HAD-IIB family hydrolase n=1 Tax=Konateibacter massiliensis TaxID=2002841 RepID=UPI000C14F80E|nr:Cof-type HAD-IIB family hydrolase [Konateibacter massiliensis]